MSKDDYWHDMALNLSKSAQRIYYDALASMNAKDAYKLAAAAYSDNNEYQRRKRKLHYGRN